MAVGKAHPLLGESIHSQSGYFSAIRVIATNIAITQVIGQNDDDVRSPSGETLRVTKRGQRKPSKTQGY